MYGICAGREVRALRNTGEIQIISPIFTLGLYMDLGTYLAFEKKKTLLQKDCESRVWQCERRPTICVPKCLFCFVFTLFY